MSFPDCILTSSVWLLSDEEILFDEKGWVFTIGVDSGNESIDVRNWGLNFLLLIQCFDVGVCDRLSRM